MEERPTVRLTRTSKPKVKSGCGTCKQRRIKCDEAKPACERCRSAGRQCSGYSQPVTYNRSKNNSAMELLLRKAPEVYTGTEAEIGALEFFYRKTAPQLAGYFDADFWTRLVFQMGHAENTIRHAMIALGSLARQHVESTERASFVSAVAIQEILATPDPTRMNLPLIQQQKEESFALTHYNKAIAELASRIRKCDIPVEAVLLACILFVCLEFLRGDVQPALKHFRSGMNVALASKSLLQNSVDHLALYRVHQNIVPFFNRLELLSTLLGNDADWEYGTSLEETIPKTFTNMRQARDRLVNLMNLAVRFIRANKIRRYQNVDLSDEAVRQLALQNQLEKWRQAFESTILSESITALDLHAARVLCLFHVVTVIWTEIALRPDELKTDEWNLQFERAVDLADAIQGEPGDYEQCSAPSFLFEMEIVSPLWFVVTKCRHPVTRRRATDILKRSRRREGLWDSQLAAVVAERLMFLEERNLTTLDGNETPPERDRIHATDILSAPETCSNTQRYIATYYYKPNGLNMSWRTLHEEIELVRIT